MSERIAPKGEGKQVMNSISLKRLARALDLHCRGLRNGLKGVMAMNEGYRSTKVIKRRREKMERTDFERSLTDWIRASHRTNELLMIIAMILVGIFLRLVFG